MSLVDEIEITDEIIADIRALLPKNMVFVRAIKSADNKRYLIVPGLYRKYDTGKIERYRLEEDVNAISLRVLHKRYPSLNVLDILHLAAKAYVVLVYQCGFETGNYTIEDFE